MVKVRLFKVLELPSHPAASAIYYVLDGDRQGIKQYVTDFEGNAFPVLAEADIGNIDLGTFE